jgi:hypothetical protein
LSAIERLNLRFLVDAQHQRFVRRMKMPTYNVAHFFHQQWIFGKLEGLNPMRLHRKGPRCG